MDGYTVVFKEVEDHVAKVKQKALTSEMKNNPVYDPFLICYNNDCAKVVIAD